jgi:hypothetical protein
MNKFSLAKHPKITSVFLTPADYFDTFPTTILQKIETNSPEKKPIYKSKPFAFSAAAVLLVALSIPFFSNNSVVTLEEIDTVVLEHYLSYQSNFSAYELSNIMESSEIDALQTTIDLEDEAIEHILITNPNFENYIIE